MYVSTIGYIYCVITNHTCILVAVHIICALGEIVKRLRGNVFLVLTLNFMSLDRMV